MEDYRGLDSNIQTSECEANALYECAIAAVCIEPDNLLILSESQVQGFPWHTSVRISEKFTNIPEIIDHFWIVFIYWLRNNANTISWKCLFLVKCLNFVQFLLLFFFLSYGDVTIINEVLQILIYTQHSWPLSSECFKRATPALLPSVWHRSCHYLF